MTTPRDAIGLSERLRSTTEMMACRCSVPMDLWQDHSSAALEAATALDSLQARVKELEAADRYANLISIIADIREKSGLGGYPMLSELADAIGSKLAEAESRVTRAEQERDEAYARAAEEANGVDPNILKGKSDHFVSIYCAARVDAAAAIRRLAAGTEKEGK